MTLYVNTLTQDDSQNRQIEVSSPQSNINRQISEMGYDFE